MANILADFKDGQDFVSGIEQGQAKRRAGAKLASRDYAGAAGELYGTGLLKEGAGAQGMEEHQEDRTLSQADDERKRQIEEATQRVGYIQQVAQALGQVPLDKRNDAFEHVVPAFQQMGLPPEVIDQMRAAPKDDATLQAFGAHLVSELKLFSTRDGVVAADPRTGDARLSYKTAPDPADAERERHNREMERLGGINAGANATRARKVGASSATASPSGRVLGATLDPNDGW